MLKSSGFTLIETVVITFIISFLALVSSIYLKGYQESIQLLHTKREIRTALNHAGRRALVFHKGSIVTVDSKHNLVIQGGDSYSKKVKLPENIQVQGMKNNLWISDKGTVSPRTIVLSSKTQQATIKIQMMWGKMIDG